MATPATINQQLAAPPQPSIATKIEQLIPQIEKALPAQFGAERFARIALTELRRNKQLATAAEANPASFLGALMLASQTGLEPGPLGLSYLVPRKGEVVWQIGYKGIIQLAQRSGKVRKIHAQEVRAGDDFDFEEGTSAYVRHRRPLNVDRGDPVAYYAYAELASGATVFELLDVGQVEARRKRSSAPNSPAWRDDYAAMARKSAVRALWPWLPVSTEESQVLAWDGAAAPRWDPATAPAPDWRNDIPDDADDDVAEAEVVDDDGRPFE